MSDTIRLRTINERELDDIATCCMTDPGWASEYTIEKMRRLVQEEMDGLRIVVPPSTRPTELFFAEILGAPEPLFVQVRTADGTLRELYVRHEDEGSEPA